MITTEQAIEVVDKLDSQGLIRKNRLMGQWYSIYCPFHSSGNESRPSCGVSLINSYEGGKQRLAGTFNCFVCGPHSLTDGITEILHNHNVDKSGSDWLKENIEGYSDIAADSEFDRLLPDETVIKLNDQIARNKAALENLQKKLNTTTEYVSEEELAKYRFTVPYMYERKLTDAVIDLYDVGYDGDWHPNGRKNPVPCITFPVRDLNKRTIFLCRRSIQGKFFNYPSGAKKPIYGLEVIPNNCNQLLIMESCFNVLTARVYGYYAIGLLGTGDSYQLEKIKQLGAKEIIIALDPDFAGDKGSNRIRKALSNVAIITKMYFPEGKDANDCTKEEFDEIYNNRH